MAAPELRLKVTLDTSFLKGQIARLPLDFAGANVSIRPKFDRQTIANEFRLLNRYIGGKKFNIIVASNLDAEIQNADRLVKALGRVQQAAAGVTGGLPIGSKGLSRTQKQGGFTKAEIKTLFGAAVQGGLIDEKTLGKTRGQMVAALGSIGRDSIAGLLNGLQSGNADLQKAAQLLGSNLISSFKGVLGIASPSREFKKIGEAAGQGFEQGLLKSIEIAEQSATRKMRGMLDRLARMALMMSGMSGPEIGRQVAQARALPSLNFGATTPRSPVSIGPSSTGRALPPGADRPGLPGTSFASQKLLLGDLLTPSMKTAIRDAANDFIDGIRQRMNEAIRQIKVEDLGRVSQRTLTGSRVAGYLPPVARFGEGRTASPYSTGRLGREGETRAELFARREREARMRSALRGVDVMGAAPSRAPAPYSQSYRASPSSVSAIVPYAAGGAIVPSGGGGGGGTGGTGGGPGDFARRGGGPGGAFNIPKLPGAGLMREIGTEFGFAAKQVLLFGTAYKALAFIQGFPAQVGSAVGALQSFRNTLGAISPSAEEAAASSQFILDIVDKYNTPIQSARDGFTKLYASMKPTGFSGDEIRDLFLGISQAAATFGMSAEKVDRVNYAFAQMASKGQVMSEELKGQLGDVLPGAMGIFAEAAGFEGPEAITKFSKALEDGAYKGAAMKTLLTNVGIVMRKEFGPGAEGAARTFQGVINRMQNSFKLLYESFEPVAVGFLNSVVMPMTSGIKTLTDGFNAFFTGTLAKTEGGTALAQQLNNLKPSFEGILANIQSLIPSFQLFGSVLFNAAKLLASLAGNPIVGFLLNVYTNVLLVNTAFTLLGGRILLGVIASVNATIVRIIALDFTIKALGVQTMGAKTALAGTQLQMLLLQRSAAGMVGPLSLSNVALAVLAGKALLVAGGLALLGKAVYDTNETFRNFVNNIGGVIASDFKNAVEGMAEDARSSANSIETSFQNLTSKLNPIGDFIRQLFRDVFQDTSNSAQNSAIQSTNAFADFFNSLSSNATAGFNGLSAVIGNWWSSLPAPIRRIFEGNGVSMLVGAAQYVGSAGGRASQGKPKGQPERQGPYVPDRLKKPPSTGDLPPLATLPTGGGGTGGSGGNKGASDAKRLREEIARQAAAASDALFAEQQRLLILQQTNPIAEAFAKYTSQDLTIQKELNVKLKEAKSDKEKINLEETARLQTAANLLDLERSINEAGEQALAPITELLKNQREELALTTETEKLIREGMSPERAKQVAQVRQLVAKQLESLDLSIDQAESAIVEAKARGASTEQVEKLIAALDRLKKKREEGEGEGSNAEKGVPQDKPKDYLGDALTSAEARLKELLNPAYQLAEAAKTIGDSFGEAFKGIITGSMTVQEAFAGLFQSIADRFADMVAQMIAEYLKMALIKGIAALIGGIFGGGGGGSDNSAAKMGLNTPDMQQYAPLPREYANGGIAYGGFTAFANGGMVTGPTMGLVGEGRYNEAIVPLPDGKSIPVQLAGGDGGNQIVSNITVNVNNGQAQSNATGSNSSEMGRKIEGAVKQVIVGELRPGGLLASKK
jgi:tape measure domain-containing protein